MAPCHVLTKRFAFTRAIPRGVSQIPKYLVKKAGDSLDGFERLLLHYSGNSIGVARCMAQGAANRIRLFGVEPIHAVQEPMDSFLGYIYCGDKQSCLCPCGLDADETPRSAHFVYFPRV